MDIGFSMLGLRGKTSFTLNGMDMVVKGMLGNLGVGARITRKEEWRRR